MLPWTSPTRIGVPSRVSEPSAMRQVPHDTHANEDDRRGTDRQRYALRPDVRSANASVALT